MSTTPLRLLGMLFGILAFAAAGLTSIGSGSAGATPVTSPAPRPTLISVSCVSAKFCMAGDTAGRVLRYDGSRWTTSARFTGHQGGQIDSVSCSSTTFCMAAYEPDIGNYFQLLTYDGRSWTPSGGYAGNYFGHGDCPSSRLCFVFDSAGNIHGWTGTKWVVLKARFDDNVVAAACASTSLCFALAQDGDLFRYDGRTWTRSNHRLVGDSRWRSISCPATHACSAISGDGQLARYTGTWGRTRTARGGAVFTDHELTGDCPTTTFCAAVDYNGSTARYANDAWSQDAFSLPGAEAVSCAAKSFCVAAGYRGSYWVYTTEGWGARHVTSRPAA